jgi:hypothetical protein
MKNFNPDILALTRNTPYFIGRGMIYPIFVRPKCFELEFWDFVSVILNHEYIHARHKKEGIVLGDGTLLTYLNLVNFFNDHTVYLLSESIAYGNELAVALKEGKLSKFILNSTFKNFQEVHEMLIQMNRFQSYKEEQAVRLQIDDNLNLLKKLRGKCL